MPSFSNKKRLKFVITLGTGSFGSSGDNKIILEGFRATANIDKAGGMMMGTLRAQIFGVSQADMASATTLQWKPREYLPNTVEVYAIDGATETLVFAGNIVNAWGDYSSLPDVHLQLHAQAAFYAQLKAVAPRSFKGAVDVATVMGQIAKSMGLGFEPNGVTVKLSDVYLANTDLEQARSLAHMAGIELWIDDATLAISAANTPRTLPIPNVSPDSGLVGYPTFDGVGVCFTTLFNPSVQFGGSVKLSTDIPQAAGEWVVTSVAYRLESEKLGGAWFATVRGNANGNAVVYR